MPHGISMESNVGLDVDVILLLPMEIKVLSLYQNDLKKDQTNSRFVRMLLAALPRLGAEIDNKECASECVTDRYVSGCVTDR